MWERIEAGLKHAFRQSPQVQRLLAGVTADVAQGRLAASTAARLLLGACHPGLDPGSTLASNS
jgi:LAO/AO transport system kinase